MNETENTCLLLLYKLLWEQIKDEEANISLVEQTLIMQINGVLSFRDECILDGSISGNIQISEDKKAFVQRMIKELENDK